MNQLGKMFLTPALGFILGALGGFVGARWWMGGEPATARPQQAACIEVLAPCRQRSRSGDTESARWNGPRAAAELRRSRVAASDPVHAVREAANTLGVEGQVRTDCQGSPCLTALMWVGDEAFDRATQDMVLLLEELEETTGADWTGRLRAWPGADGVVLVVWQVSEGLSEDEMRRRSDDIAENVAAAFDEESSATTGP